jgi:hypothetical protein
MQFPFSVHLQTTFEVFGFFTSYSELTGTLPVLKEAFSWMACILLCLQSKGEEFHYGSQVEFFISL